MNKTVVVTGSSGFVGGQTVLDLKDHGYTVIGIDDRPTPTHLQGVADHVITADYVSPQALNTIVEFQVGSVVHCAATSLVGPSVRNPEIYYQNNVVKTKALLDYILKNSPQTRMIFSSSSSVYGQPVMVPIAEVDPPAPISPYGESKYMTDMMMASYERAYNLEYVSFRYFNAVGADPQARHGQEPNVTHLIGRMLESIRANTVFTINGVEYNTPDGSCIRDHVHVADVAQAHRLAIDRQVPSGVYNVGVGHGVSNLEVVKTVEEITGKKVNLKIGPPRAGDPEQLMAETDKLVAQGWQPKYSLTDMVTHAWAWYNR